MKSTMLSTSPSNWPTIADCAPSPHHTQTTMEMEDLENMSGFFLDDYSAPGSPYNLMEEFSSIPAPSDDIWKKFELLPTPPRSPDRSDDKIFDDVFYDQEIVDFDEDLLLSDIIFEHEDIVDEILRSDVELFKPRDSPVGWSSKTQTGELLHDCMWAGECAVNCTQKAAREKQDCNGVIVLKSTSSCEKCEPYECMGDAVGVATSPDNVLPRTASLEEDCGGVEATRCVDPSAVLAYTPLSDHCYHQPTLSTDSSIINDVCLSSAAASAQTAPSSATASSKSSASSQPIVLVRSRGVWKRDLNKREYVMSDTPSESDDDDDEDDEEDDDDDDDDDDDEEEDEEIDVVTVAGERQQHQNGHSHHRAATSRSARGHHYHPQQAHHHQRHHQQHHSQQNHHHQQPTSPPASRTTSSGRVVTPSQKLLSNGSASRRKRHHHATGSVKRRRASRQAVAVVPVHQPPAKRSRRGGEDLYASSCSSSDNPEDHERRKEHNSMERKRRDDLRSAFQHLRLMVPSLRDNPKAPKVMILNRAADHARELTSQSASVEDALRKEVHRQRALRKRLAQLQQRNRKQR